jgi:hypothetical protein
LLDRVEWIDLMLDALNAADRELAWNQSKCYGQYRVLIRAKGNDLLRYYNTIDQGERDIGQESPDDPGGGRSIRDV